MSAPATELKPALAPPHGFTSNFIDPPSQAYVIIISMIFFLAVTTPFVLVRIYTRHYINRRLWWDDYTAIIAWIGLFGFAGLTLKCLNYGMGVDLWNVPAKDGAHFTKLFGNIEIVARISMFFTKLSILLLFLRIFVPSQTKKTKIYYSSWVVIWFNLLYCIALVLVVLLQCVNKQEIPGKTCIDTYSLLVTASLINVISDLMMLAIPLAAVWDLHMPMRRKLGISVVFAVGMLAVASSIARLVWQVLHARDPNRTIVLMKVVLLAIAEHAIGVIVGCMPVLPALFRHISHQRKISKSSSSPSTPTSWKTAFGTQSYIRHQRKKPHDPYLLTMDEMESGQGLTTSSPSGMEKMMGTTTTTINGGGSEVSISNFPGGANGRNTAPLVSTSVQVESHPRMSPPTEEEENQLTMSPPAVFVRK